MAMMAMLVSGMAHLPILTWYPNSLSQPMAHVVFQWSPRWGVLRFTVWNLPSVLKKVVLVSWWRALASEISQSPTRSVGERSLGGIGGDYTFFRDDGEGTYSCEKTQFHTAWPLVKVPEDIFYTFHLRRLTAWLRGQYANPEFLEGDLLRIQSHGFYLTIQSEILLTLVLTF